MTRNRVGHGEALHAVFLTIVCHGFPDSALNLDRQDFIPFCSERQIFNHRLAEDVFIIDVVPAFESIPFLSGFLRLTYLISVDDLDCGLIVIHVDVRIERYRVNLDPVQGEGGVVPYERKVVLARNSKAPELSRDQRVPFSRKVLYGVTGERNRMNSRLFIVRIHRHRHRIAILLPGRPKRGPVIIREDDHLLIALPDGMDRKVARRHYGVGERYECASLARHAPGIAGVVGPGKTLGEILCKSVTRKELDCVIGPFIPIQLDGILRVAMELDGKGVLLRQGAGAVTIVLPAVTIRNADCIVCNVCIDFLDPRLVGRCFHRRFRARIKHDRAAERAAFQHQAEAVHGIVATGRDLYVAGNRAVARDRHADGRIARVAADVKGEVACLSGDRRILDHHVAVVVGHYVAAPDAGSVDDHVVQRQVAVVLNQEACILGRRCDRTVLERDRVVLEELEPVVFRSGRADALAAEVVGEACEVNCEASRELALRRDNAVARAVLQHRDRVAVLSIRERRFKRRVADGLYDPVIGISDFRDCFTDLPPFVCTLDRALAANNVLSIGFNCIFTAGNELRVIAPGSGPCIELAAADFDTACICSSKPDITAERAAGNNGGTGSGRVGVQGIRTHNCAAGYVDGNVSSIHNLNAHVITFSADRTAIDGDFTAVAVEHTDRRCFLRIDRAAVDGDLAGAVVVDRVCCRARACVVEVAAVHDERPLVADQVTGIAAGIIVGTIPSPGRICAADQFAVLTAVLDRQGAEVPNQCRSSAARALTDDFMAIEVKNDILARINCQGISFNRNCIIREHGDRDFTGQLVRRRDRVLQARILGLVRSIGHGRLIHRVNQHIVEIDGDTRFCAVGQTVVDLPQTTFADYERRALAALRERAFDRAVSDCDVEVQRS